MIARMSDGAGAHASAPGRADVSADACPNAHSQVFAPGVLAGQVAIVTGGGTGLGKATAIELARCGAHVVVMGRRGDVLEQAVREIDEASGQGSSLHSDARAREAATREDASGDRAPRASGDRVSCTSGDRAPRVFGDRVSRPAGRAGWVEGDVRDRESARRVIEEVIERRGRLDILVNNAGGQYFTPAEAIVAKGWRAVWRLNVEGMLNMAEAAVELGLGAEPPAGRPGAPARSGSAAERQTGADGRGTIVNVTLSPHHGMPGMAHSGAARATVEALTRELAKRWAGKIAVTAVAAGHYDTEAMQKYPDTVRAGMALSVPLQRLGRPEEHAWLVALLCTPVGRGLSGSTITLDGARDNWFGPWPPPGLTGGTGEVPTEARRESAP